MKNFIKNHPILKLIIGLAALLLIQQKVVMPLVYEVIKSDMFLVDSNDKASQLPISTHLTEIAFTHCNQYIKSKLDPNLAITYPEKPINAWSLGNYQYVINAEITISSEPSKSSTKKYACRITYNNGDNQDGVSDFDNWTIDGLSGLDEI
ncbi:MAG: hypothetical protein PHH59_13135 [Methylovulum sp.]|uniref:hypothetical protein n=1 Tax=Methylovulum sp. TaxID=1916980 RepID=UPI00262280E6|nr:hypothetical protein [Methylovulum sp.]MDD2724951.1 hypothetical protein [Methylovulum sp.]MDD5123525.1 hypothetical protein [Methylovulum sp.]